MEFSWVFLFGESKTIRAFHFMQKTEKISDVPNDFTKHSGAKFYVPKFF